MAAYTTVDNAGAHFNPILYSGTGSSNAITGVGFAPDLVWQKNRLVSPVNHILEDTVRGTDSQLYSSSTSTEGTLTNLLTSFDSDGFTAGTSADYNGSGTSNVAWNWKGGTTTGIAGSPSITPDSYTFNATGGFSIIAYTGNGTAGATLPHGLGTADIGMIIVKGVNLLTDWVTYHKFYGATKFLDLNTTAAIATSAVMWNDTEPTSTLFSLGDDNYVNRLSPTTTYIAYVFAEIPGYSKFGKYMGTGNVDGSYVYTGFRPAFLLLKNSESGGAWHMNDNKRLGYNPDNETVFANTTGAEVTTDFLDINSTGFKIRNTDSAINENGSELVYAAFAESPFVNSEGVPVNAR